VLLGPPTYAGRKPMRNGDDSSDASSNGTGVRHDIQSAQQVAKDKANSTGVKLTNAQQQGISDHLMQPNSTMTDSSADASREVWHYRRELLPPGVPYQQVDFDFITRTGYGFKVLQRESAPVTTLDAASKPAA